MGRAGGGHSGGGHSSGGHSSSRSSGGHRVSSSSRAGQHSYSSGSSYRGYRGGFGGGHHHTWHIYPHRHYCYISNLIYIFWFVVACVIILSMITSNVGIPKSTQNREKLVSEIGYTNDCVIDELGWVDNVTQTEKSIKYFYDKTGVQPYIVLKDYDSTLTSDEEKEQYAANWYDEHINNESTFLYMYFAEQDTDNDVGYMAYVNGKQVSSVMDSEAIEIFWSYIDKYWYSDMSTDDMFELVFVKTADRIMTKTATIADVGMNVTKVIFVVVVFAGIVIVMVIRRKHKAEEAKETEKILNTPLNGESEADDLLKKYKGE